MTKQIAKKEKKPTTWLDLRKGFARGSSFRTLLENEMSANQNAERIIGLAIEEIKNNPKLMECSFESLAGAILMVARLGLYPGSALGHAYFVPFYNKKKKRDDCQVIIGYKGYIYLGLRSGFCKTVTARCVYENDYFHYELGLNEDIIHRPALDNPGALVKVYSVAELTSGAKMFTVMSRREVDKIKGDKRYGIWVDHYEEMAKKTAIRRLFKYLPLSVEMALCDRLDFLNEKEEEQCLERQIEGEFCSIGADKSAEEDDGNNKDGQASVDDVVLELKKG